MKKTAIVILEEGASPVLVLFLFYGCFILLAILCFANPFFKHLFSFSSIVMTFILSAGCLGAANDREKGIERIKPKTKKVIPKWTLHVFFLIMIAVSAGLRLGFYSIAVCWVVSWVALYSTIQHVKATYKKEETCQKD